MQFQKIANNGYCSWHRKNKQNPEATATAESNVRIHIIRKQADAHMDIG